MTYTFENIMAAQIPAYAIGASQFATQVSTFTLCTGMASQAYSLLGDSFSGDARGAQLGDAATLASASGALVDNSSQLMAALNETEVRLAAAKGKVMAVVAEVEASPAAPLLIGAGGKIIVLPRPDDYGPPPPGARAGRELAGAVLDAKMQAAIALANGEDLRGNLQTCAIGLDLASMLKTIFSPAGAPGPGGDQWTPDGLDELDVEDPELVVAAGPDPDGYYQGLTSYTPPSAAGAAALGATPAVAAGAAGAGAGSAGGGFLGVPGARGRKVDDDDKPEVRQWSLTEETDEFWRATDTSTTDGVLA